ncbi:hypothetical protein [Fimbriiglobus ruber]|uniref:DUF4276 family protein n=1 Tax=Fimbriiglobus ruber TaxID=1908690 RepID=A0A225DXH7_9BACT|nr:hypothetical protein [Fimbriiglobus ruber]OWK45663.1 hypothetical protein FRUB_01994 [Fimbriiglobus ruber]
MSLRFAVVYEAEADFRTAAELADRVLVESIDWLEDEHLVHLREWVAELTGGRRLMWKAIKQQAKDAGIRMHGHFDGEPGLADAAAARRAILYLLTQEPAVQAIVLIRDQDDQPERRTGLEQARAQDRSGIPIIVGLAVVERECWVINGFEPQDDAESERMEAERRTLGFDPRLRSHELTACKDDGATRSPKRVLQKLTDGDFQRERCCWTDTALEILRERGVENGLVAYLHEVRDKLAPLIGHVSRQ